MDTVHPPARDVVFLGGVIETTRRKLVHKIEGLLTRPRGRPSRGAFHGGTDIMPVEF